MGLTGPGKVGGRTEPVTTPWPRAATSRTAQLWTGTGEMTLAPAIMAHRCRIADLGEGARESGLVSRCTSITTSHLVTLRPATSFVRRSRLVPEAMVRTVAPVNRRIRHGGETPSLLAGKKLVSKLHCGLVGVELPEEELGPEVGGDLGTEQLNHEPIVPGGGGV